MKTYGKERPEQPEQPEQSGQVEQTSPPLTPSIKSVLNKGDLALYTAAMQGDLDLSKHDFKVSDKEKPPQIAEKIMAIYRVTHEPLLVIKNLHLFKHLSKNEWAEILKSKFLIEEFCTQFASALSQGKLADWNHNTLLNLYNQYIIPNVHVFKNSSKDEWEALFKMERSWASKSISGKFLSKLDEGMFSGWSEKEFLTPFLLFEKKPNNPIYSNIPISKVAFIVKSPEGRLAVIEKLLSLGQRNLILENINQFDLKSFSETQIKKYNLLIAKDLALQGKTEEFFLFIGEDFSVVDQENKNALLLTLLETGDKKVVLREWEQFDTSSWGRNEWIKILEGVKNQLVGVEFTEKVPKHLHQDPSVKKLINECRETEKVLNKEALIKLTGHMWTAVERKQDPETGGYFTIFESVPDLDVAADPAISENRTEEIIRETYPAIEIPAVKMKDIHDDFIHSPHKELGFEIKYEGHSRLTIPDITIINHRWSKLCEKDPTLPKLSILQSPGIMPDKEFLEAQLKYHAICSDGVEFLHDMLLHLLPTLAFMYNKREDYAKFRKEWTSLLQVGLEKIDKSKEKGEIDDRTYEQFLNLLSYAADVFSSRVSDEGFAKIYTHPNYLRKFPSLFGYKTKDPIIDGFLDRTFGEKRLSKDEFREGWKRIFEWVST